MSYLAHLVQRTLGITPVVRPVLQAKFAPPSQLFSMARLDGDSVENTTSAPPVRGLDSTPHGNEAATVSGLRPIRSESNALGQRGPENPSERSLTGQTRTASASLIKQRVANEMSSPPLTEERTTRRPALAQENSDASVDGGTFRLMSERSRIAIPPEFDRRSSVSSRASEDQSNHAPVVRIHIGRVDVRLVTPGTSEKRVAAPAAVEAKPASLEDYLKEKLRGQR